MTTARNATELPGLDLEAVSKWSAMNLDCAPPLHATLLDGGRSNLTFRLEDSNGRRFVLRRPPVSHVHATAHDVGREHLIVEALIDSGVPVARPLCFCDDNRVTGAPFTVAEYVAGHSIRTADDASRLLTPHHRSCVSADLVRVLATIHAVDLQSTGLESFARRGSYVGRQLRRWWTQFEQSSAITGANPRWAREVREKLDRGLPASGGTALVHGDYRLDNVLVDPSGKVLAVVDWELAAIGDPLADVGTLLVYWSEPEDNFLPLGDAPTIAPGFFTRADIIECYRDVSGTDIGDIGYYMAFAAWKLACIVDGVNARAKSGALGAGGDGVALPPATVARLLAMADDLLGGTSPVNVD